MVTESSVKWHSRDHYSGILLQYVKNLLFLLSNRMIFSICLNWQICVHCTSCIMFPRRVVTVICKNLYPNVIVTLLVYLAHEIFPLGILLIASRPLLLFIPIFTASNDPLVPHSSLISTLCLCSCYSAPLSPLVEPSSLCKFCSSASIVLYLEASLQTKLLEIDLLVIPQ